MNRKEEEEEEEEENHGEGVWGGTKLADDRSTPKVLHLKPFSLFLDIR